MSDIDMKLDTDRQIRRQVTIALASLLLVGGSFLAWSLLVPLQGAVVAQGIVAVDGNVKKVQHQSGGIIGQLLVKDGSKVKAGDVVARLDETQTRMNLRLVMNELVAARARLARAAAERENAAAMTFPVELVDRAAREAEVREILDNETKLFLSRRNARQGQQAQLRERVGQSRKEAEGYELQLKSAMQQIKITKEEMEKLRPLYEKKLVNMQRWNGLERDMTRNEAVIADTTARGLQARGRISEIEVQIAQIDRERIAEANKDTREAETKIGEMSERRIAAEDQLRRIDIRAPAAGVVHELAVHTVGGVINPAEPLMLIVPESDNLIVESRVPPQDIDQVRFDQLARVRFSSFNQRTTPELEGSVFRISASSIRDQATGQFYYTVGIKIGDGQLARLNGAQLIPGMLADTFIATDERTAMSFLMRPLVDNFNRVFAGR
jgi:HlyD family secretion protein